MLRNVALACSAWAVSLILEGCGGGGGHTPTAQDGTCGKASPSTVRDCQNVDFGSCGNACCNLLLEVEEGPSDVVKMLLKTLDNGGPDGQYAVQKTAGGAVGFDNLTQYSPKLPAPFKDNTGVFIGQVHHTTSGKHYVDTVDLNLRAKEGGGTIIHAFSLSLIAGALGDQGQNYKNIIMLMDGAPWSKKYKVTQHLDNSCPAAGELQSQVELPPLPHIMPKAALRADSPPIQDGTCGKASPSTVQDCQNVDFGSCGNACCAVLIKVINDPLSAIAKLNATLANGGPDGAYTLQATAEDTVGFANLTKNAADLPEPFHNSTHGVYIGQVHHMTKGDKHYNDTISFNIRQDPGSKGSLIRMSSVSLIGGALGDHGQGYKNIKMAMDTAFGMYYKIQSHYFNSCPPPPAKIIV